MSLCLLDRSQIIHKYTYSLQQISLYSSSKLSEKTVAFHRLSSTLLNCDGISLIFKRQNTVNTEWIMQREYSPLCQDFLKTGKGDMSINFAYSIELHDVFMILLNDNVINCLLIFV